MTQKTFDPAAYKETTREQWQAAAEAWHRWGPTLRSWLGPATLRMLDLASVKTGSRVLDIAAGAGDQSLQTAERVGPTGSVLATDISPAILEFAASEAERAGLSNMTTRVMDGERLDLADASFDAVISRVGLIYFPDQQKALSEMHRVLVHGGRIAAIVYSTPEKNGFFSGPISVVRRHANLGTPLPGQPGPFSLGSDGVLESAFVRAGFRNVSVESTAAPLRMSSPQEYLRFAKESFGALHQMLSSLEPAARAAAWAEVATNVEMYAVNGEYVGPCELLIAVGEK
jgi:ubiquinone/menaquinone biosynthesis C-methylase UbiE